MPFLCVPEQLRPCSASEAQFDDVLRELTPLRRGLDVPNEQLGFVDARGPGPSTTPSTDPVPTVHEQAEVEVTPQDQPTVESHSSSVPEPETERLTVTPDVSPHMSQFPMLTKINFEKNCSTIKDAGA